MAKIPRPSGYVRKAVPKSHIEAVSAKAHDRAKTLTKGALEHYIRSFMDTDGENRSYMTALSPSSLNFITDKSIQDDQDPRRKQTQLTRLYEEVEERTPAILLVDTSFEWVPNTLGELAGARILRDENEDPWWVGQFHITAKVGLSVAVLTNDQETTDSLGTFLLLIFKQMKNVAGGSRIVSPKPEDQWEVRLPMNPKAAQTTPQNTKEDPKDQLWATTVEMEMSFEDNFLIKRPFVGWENDYSTGQRINKDSNVPPEIIADDSVSINSRLEFQVAKMEPQQRVILSNPNIATLDAENCVVTPRKLGTFKLQVIDPTKTQGEGTMNAPAVAAEKAIEVVL